MHPVELDPDLRDRMRAAGQAERLERELADLARRVDGHQGSLGREFDRVVDVLAQRGYIDLGGDEAPGWALTPSGAMLANIFHECDLLVAECLRLGWLDGVEAPVLAGLLSTFVYEHRSPEPPAPPWFPNAGARERWRLVAATSEDLAAGERAGGLAPHRPPDAGFFGAAHGWTAGHDLEAVVRADELTGGDFVRSMKQVIDLARQVADVAPVAATRDAARKVARSAFRGIVADGTVASGATDAP